MRNYHVLPLLLIHGASDWFRRVGRRVILKLLIMRVGIHRGEDQLDAVM